MFAYEQMLKQGELSSTIHQISDWLAMHEYGQKDLPSCITGYPNSLERAHLGMLELKKKIIRFLIYLKIYPKILIVV